MTDPTPQTTPTRDEAVPTGWRCSINYGPDGEQNFANVYAADGQFVGNLRTHHAIAICNAFAVCEKLATAPAPASGRVDAVALLRDVANTHTQYCETLHRAADILASLSPAATPVSEAGGERLLRQMRALAMALHAKHYAEDAPSWQPLEDAEGILSQIDNMTAALAKPTSSPAGGNVVEIDEISEAVGKTGMIIRGDGSHTVIPIAVVARLLELARVGALSQSTSAGRVGG